MCQKLKYKKLWVGGGNLQIFKGKLCNLKLTKNTITSIIDSSLPKPKSTIVAKQKSDITIT